MLGGSLLSRVRAIGNGRRFVFKPCRLWFIPQRAFIVLVALTAAFSGSAVLTSCESDDPASPPSCLDEPISPALDRVFYWGDGGPSDFVPNQGQPAGNARQPLWISDETILAFSETLTHGQSIQGVFAISINPATLEFDTVQTYQLPGVRWAYDYDPITDKLAITYSAVPDSFQIALCRLAGQQVVIDETMVGSSWRPSGVQFLRGHGGIIFYGADPNTNVPGFYLHNASGDSLLFSANLTFNEARSFGLSPDESHIYYGSSDGAPLGPSRVYSAALDGSDIQVVHEGKGLFVALDVNPIDGRLIIDRFAFGTEDNRRGSIVVLVNPESKETIQLDVRTHESSCLSVLAHDPCWSPDGTKFAFSGSAMSGEGTVFPIEVWVSSVTK